MRASKKLEILYKGMIVGTLALTDDKKVAFEYTEQWIKNGFSISPFSLPLKKGVFVPSKSYFGGLYGVFADSLPDAWGNILLNRLLKKRKICADELSVLDRLAIVGSSGMGALVFQPEMLEMKQPSVIHLDELARQCQRILTTEYDDNLDEIYRLGGTSGGARPKIMTQIEGEDWLVKFPAHVDRPDAGKMEYDYSVCAKRCGIIMTDTRLLPSDICSGYFGTKRFDRLKTDSEGKQRKGKSGTQRVHRCTAAGLLELDFEQQSLDYHELMKLTKILTRDNQEELEQMFRRMCFNVFAHNRDDHSKNFTFLYDDKTDRWGLSPAYDLTYSSTYYGEHTTSVDGNGKNPGKKELMNVGTMAGIQKKRCEMALREIEEYVRQDLSSYLE